jgi:predicted metal-dependent hydrolase
VVAHEVAHLRHMNHGAQFHALEHGLSRFGERARVWLRRHGAGLLRVGTRPPSSGVFTLASSAPQ